MYELRDYQEKAISELFSWWKTNKGNPLIEAPTGAGKSLIIAEICRRAISLYPKTRILMLTHKRELIQQDYDTLKSYYENADIGIYCAGLNAKDLNHKIIFGSVQSINNHTSELGYLDFVLVDEAHLINHNDTGIYRKVFNDLKKENKALKVIGLTATPYRLSHGYITDKPSIFDEPIIKTASIKELQDKGFLCQLTSKATKQKFDLSEVHIQAGEYNQKELVKAVNTLGNNENAVNETIKRAEGRHSWLVFCTSIEHAKSICELLNSRGVKSAVLSSLNTMEERDRIITDFKEQRITALCNVDILSTGFNYTGIDLIVMLRPTMSAGLYVQQLGRGLRTNPNKKDCLILDFAGNVLRHGTVYNIIPPNKKGKKGIAPCKVCPQCDELLPLNAKRCSSCGYEYPEKQAVEDKWQLSDMDIQGTNSIFLVSRWSWIKTTSKAGNPTIQITYYAKNILAKPIREYLLLWSNVDFIRNKALSKYNYLLDKASKFENKAFLSLEAITTYSTPPVALSYHKNEKNYPVIDKYFWRETNDVKTL